MSAVPPAMILAAGRGTRLAPLTDRTPKPLLPVRGRPLIEWQIEALARAGVTHVVVNLHHLGAQIEHHLGDGSRLGVDIVYSHESALLETGGGIRQALPLLDSSTFLVVNGDVWSDFDFRQLPHSPGAEQLAHLVLTPTPDYREHGDFTYADGLVTGRGEAFVFCGIAVLRRELFDNAPNGPFSVASLYFELLKTRQVGAQIHEGEWLDIGTLAQYQSLDQR